MQREFCPKYSCRTANDLATLFALSAQHTIPDQWVLSTFNVKMILKWMLSIPTAYYKQSCWQHLLLRSPACPIRSRLFCCFWFCQTWTKIFHSRSLSHVELLWKTSGRSVQLCPAARLEEKTSFPPVLRHWWLFLWGSLISLYSEVCHSSVISFWRSTSSNFIGKLEKSGKLCSLGENQISTYPVEMLVHHTRLPRVL